MGHKLIRKRITIYSHSVIVGAGERAASSSASPFTTILTLFHMHSRWIHAVTVPITPPPLRIMAQEPPDIRIPVPR